MNKAHVFIAESHETRADIMFFPRFALCARKKPTVNLFYVDTESRSEN